MALAPSGAAEEAEPATGKWIYLQIGPPHSLRLQVPSLPNDRQRTWPPQGNVSDEPKRRIGGEPQ